MSKTHTNLATSDLTQRSPRSLRVRLGGFAVLPRLLDKCRATLAGKAGEYRFNCPLDRQFFDFTGIDAEKLKAEVAQGKGDAEMLEWVRANAPLQRTPWEIEQWSRYQESRAPELHSDSFDYFVQTAAGNNPKRGDIRSWADLLDLDDFVSYGGAA
jgi:hypothetical protein